MKKCTRCKQKKALEDFGKNRSKKDGLNTECRACKFILDRNRQARIVQQNIQNQPEPQGSKTCSRCNETKSRAEFVRDNSRANGFGHRCKPCQKDYHAEWRENSSRFKEYQAEYYLENKAQINERNKAYYHANKDWLLPLMNHRRFEKKYGMTRETALELLATQDGCGLCHTHEPGKKGWNVDHDHKTGEVRGILCGKCNTGIAFLGDDLEGANRAVAYLS